MTQTIQYNVQPDARTLTPFLYSSGSIDTITSEDGQIWFCAKHVCAVLNITWSGHTLQKMPVEWTCSVSHTMPGDGQKRDMIFINEPCMYRLAFRSSKPEAEAFCNWVCRDVLPEIRKHGFFGEMKGVDEARITKIAMDVFKRLTETKNTFEQVFLFERAQRLCRMLGQQVPAMTLLEGDLKAIEGALV